MVLVIKIYKKSEKGGEMDYSYCGYEFEIEDSSNCFSLTNKKINEVRRTK